MLINVILGFLIPWIIFGIFLYKKDKKILLIIFPIGATLALTINLIGYQLEYWDFTPILRIEPMSALPLDLGLYPLLACYLIYLIKKLQTNPLTLILIFSIFVTGIEWVGVKLGKVIYHNEWNIGWTFFSYLTAHSVVYFYYVELVRLKRGEEIGF
jgi:hypothetical protein